MKVVKDKGEGDFMKDIVKQFSLPITQHAFSYRAKLRNSNIHYTHYPLNLAILSEVFSARLQRYKKYG